MNFNRQFFARTIVGVAVVAALLIAVLPSSADLISYSITCTSTTMDVSSATSGGSDFGQLTVTANGVEIAFLDETSPFGEDGPYTVNYSLPAGDYVIVAEWTNNATTTETVTDQIQCSDAPTTSTGNICFGPGEVALAIYRYPERLDIYSIDNDEGQLSISIDSETLYGTATDPAGDVVIATSDDVLPTTLYRQIDGNFRVVVGPEPLEGKMYECVFNAVQAKSRSWLPGQEPYGPLELSDTEGGVVTTPEFTPSFTPEFTPIFTPVFTPVFTPSLD